MPAPRCVDLVDEDDRRGVRLRLLEQVAHAAGTDTDEHLDEVRAGDRVERHAGLTGDRPGEQRLAGAGRAEQQHALGDLRADGLVLDRVLQEVLELLQLLDRLVGAGDVGERRLGGVLADDLGLGLAEGHDPAATALHGVEQPEQQEQEEDERQEAHQQADQQVVLGDVRVEGLGPRTVAARTADRVEDVVGRTERVGSRDLGAALDRALQVQVERLFLVVDGGLVDVPVGELGQRRRRGHLVVATVAAEEAGGDEAHHDDDGDPDPDGPEDLLTFHTPLPGHRGRPDCPSTLLIVAGRRARPWVAPRRGATSLGRRYTGEPVHPLVTRSPPAGRVTSARATRSRPRA
jgi:hypothetical protein